MATSIEFVCETKIALAKININRNVNYHSYRPKQIECIRSALDGDALAVLPTGYGKSLIFETLPYITKLRTGINTTILIVSPLNSIINEQMNRYGERALHLNEQLLQDATDNKKTNEVLKLQTADIMYLIGHPEAFIDKRAFEIFRLDVWRECLTHIIIDEAHCVVQWGAQFRAKFMELKKLRSLFPQCKYLALTATATLKLQSEIKSGLAMKSAVTVAHSIDRPNIKFNVCKRLPSTGGHNTAEESYDAVFRPLIDELNKLQSDFLKTIVYSKLNWCGKGHEAAVRPKESTDNPGPQSSMVAQYHSPCTESMRLDVMTRMSQPSGSLRLLFATEAYSMGTDAPDIKRIVHAGVPTTLEIYLQEVGRAGRDGTDADASMHYNSTDIANNVPGMTQEMREYCRTEACRRAFLCEHFGSDYVKCSPDHLCCDNCQKFCKCSQCTCEALLEDDPECENKTCDPIISACLEDALLQYFDAENELINVPEPELLSGLSSSLAANIAKNYSMFQDAQILYHEHPILSENYVENIVILIEEIGKSM